MTEQTEQTAHPSGDAGAREAPPVRRAGHVATHAWASGSLVLAGLIGVLAKVLGVVVAPGMRGAASGKIVEQAQLASGAFAYVLTGLLVGLTGVASFELAKSTRIHAAARFPVVALSGLVIALASPAVVDRLPRNVATALSLMTALLALVASVTAATAARTRAVGIVLGLLSTASLLRVGAMEVAVSAGESASLSLFHVAQLVATAAVVLHAGALLLAGAWVGTRAGWRGRVLANVAIVLAFATTWMAGRQSETPSTLELVLRTALAGATGVPSPYGLSAVAVFLLPAGVFVAAVALIEHRRGPALMGALALALVAHGSYDVPLQALAAVVAAEWAMLARTDEPSPRAAVR